MWMIGADPEFDWMNGRLQAPANFRFEGIPEVHRDIIGDVYVVFGRSMCKSRGPRLLGYDSTDWNPRCHWFVVLR